MVHERIRVFGKNPKDWHVLVLANTENSKQYYKQYGKLIKGKAGAEGHVLESGGTPATSNYFPLSCN